MKHNFLLFPLSFLFLVVTFQNCSQKKKHEGPCPTFDMPEPELKVFLIDTIISEKDSVSIVSYIDSNFRVKKDSSLFYKNSYKENGKVYRNLRYNDARSFHIKSKKIPVDVRINDIIEKPQRKSIICNEEEKHYFYTDYLGCKVNGTSTSEKEIYINKR